MAELKESFGTGGNGRDNPFQVFIVDHPWTCIVVTLLLVAIACSGFRFWKMNNDPRVFFSADNPELQYLLEIEERFSGDDNVVFILDPADGNVFTRETLQAIKELTKQAWTIPMSQRVDSLANFQHTEVNGDELNVIDLVEEPSSLDAKALEKIRGIALNEPYLVNNVVSKTGHVAGVNVTFIPTSNANNSPMIMEEVYRIRDEFRERYPDIRFLVSGMVAYQKAQQDATNAELSTTSVYGFIAIVICLYIMLRNWVSVILTIVVVQLSIFSATGITLLMGVELSPTIGIAPAMILTLAVADSIHILMTCQHQVRLGESKRDAVLESMRVNMSPVFMTSATTAVGFLFLNTSSSPPFRDMGNMVSIGVLNAWILSVILLPALVMVVPKQEYKQGMKDYKLMDRFAEFVIKRRKPLFIGMAILCTALGATSLKNDMNDVWFEYYDDSFPVKRATSFMINELTGFHRLQFPFPSGESGGTMEPEYMKHLDRFAEWARSHSNVVFVSSFSDTVKRLNRDMNGGEEAFYRVPDSRALISQYTLMYELSLPQGLGLENQIDFDRESARVDVLLGPVSSNDILAFAEDADAWIRENMPANMQTHAAGFDLLLGELALDNMKDMLLGTALALIVVSFMLIFALRSLKYGLLSILPNLFPATVSFGIWALINGQIGLSVSVVACITIGIVVDNTVHFLSKYIRAKRENRLNSADATRYAFKTVGMALVATTIVLAANFGVMSTSHFYPNASMGLLTAITLVVALVINFLFFVPLLMFVDGSKAYLENNKKAGSDNG